MMIVADEFTIDHRTALQQSLSNNQSNFAVRNIVVLIFNNKCLVYDANIPFNNSFAFKDHTIFHPTKKNIRDRCDGINKITI